jgi:murein DD-endopeptidase MepM/ murein hydrolase activator NlpD
VLQLPLHFTPTHQTAGLPGFPAVDCFAPAHTLIAAPATGKVLKLSGHEPTDEAFPGGPYGWSIYLAGREGVYYLTHFGSRARIVKLGECIARGEVIGQVADYAKATHGKTPSHVHMGFHAGAWTP